MLPIVIEMTTESSQTSQIYKYYSRQGNKILPETTKVQQSSLLGRRHFLQYFCLYCVFCVFSYYF